MNRPSGLIGEQYLLTVTWAGAVYRFAERDVTIDEVPYTGGIEVDAPFVGVRMLDPQQSEGKSTVRGLVFPVDVAAMEGDRVYLREARAELSRWAPGSTFAERTVLLAGNVRMPEYGQVYEPVSFIIEPDGMTDYRTWPPAAAAVSLETWPGAPDGSLGALYPFPIGYPGLGSTYPNKTRGGAPGILVAIGATTSTILVAGARVGGGSVSVTQTDDDTFPTASLTVSHMTDSLGRTVAVVTWASVVADGATFSVDWSGSSGGILGLDGQPLSGLGGVVEFLLSESSVAYDPFAWASARDDLDAYRLSFYGDEPSSAWELARGELLRLAPVSVVSGPSGVEPIVWRIPAANPVLTLEDGRNCDVQDGYQTDDARMWNASTARFAPDAAGTLTGLIEIGSETHQGCAYAATKFGVIEDLEPLDTRAVYSAATMHRRLLWGAAAYALPWRVRSFDVYEQSARRLVRGDVIRVIAPKAGVNDSLGHVTEVSRGDGIAVVTVTFIDSTTLGA